MGDDVEVRIEQLKTLLRLRPHVQEGGFFAETYRSEESLDAGVFDGRYAGPGPGRRSLATAIYYLMTPEAFSAMHRLAGDEIFHFYAGDPVEMLQLGPDGSGRVVTLGTDVAAGMHPQVLVPKGVWQGSRLVPGGRFALLGTTMSPGFAYEDYEPGDREDLLPIYPGFRERILALTR